MTAYITPPACRLRASAPDFWDGTAVTGANRPLEPQQSADNRRLQAGETRPGGNEALSSYISALALDHSCSPYVLFSEVLIPEEEKLNIRWRRARNGESHLINSYGEVAKAIVQSIESCSNLSEAHNLTFLNLKPICDPKAKHLMHSSRPWCPACYREARNRGIAAWDALYSYLRTSKICIWHQHRLLLACSRCKKPQRYLPKFPFLDFCEHCGADLALQDNTEKFESASAIEERMWISRAAVDMLSRLEDGNNLTVRNFIRNIQGFVDRHFSGKERWFAARTGLSAAGPKNWRRRSSPSWATLVDLGYRLDIPPAQLCSPELPLTDPQYWRKLPAVSLDKPHARPSTEAMVCARAKLAELVDHSNTATHTIPVGLPTLAKQLKISYGVLTRNFPDECAKLVARRKLALMASKEASDRERASRLASARAALAEQGLPQTSRNLRQTGQLTVSDLTTLPKLAI